MSHPEKSSPQIAMTVEQIRTIILLQLVEGTSPHDENPGRHQNGTSKASLVSLMVRIKILESERRYDDANDQNKNAGNHVTETGIKKIGERISDHIQGTVTAGIHTTNSPICPGSPPPANVKR